MNGGLPGDLQELFDEAVALSQEGRLVEATELLERVIARAPSHIESWHHLGEALFAQRRLDEAEAARRQLARLAANSAAVHCNLGAVLKARGKSADAIAAFRRALALDPRHFEAQFNLGLTLMDGGALDEAVAELDRALDLRRDFAPAHNLLGFANLRRGRFDEAVARFRDAAGVTQDHGRPVRGTAVSKARIRHDAEQVRYLVQRGRLERRHAPYREALERLERTALRDAGGDWQMPVTPAELGAIEPSFNRLLHVAECPHLAGGAVNPALDVPTIEARYHAKRPELMHVDGFLKEEALRFLRQFCLESTIWKRDYPGGYLGAFLSDGFACPLLLQIAEELRLRFPAIFGRHQLNQAWAFKYDSVSQGLKIHADTAAVNVNFWITPDAANLDPERGGLVVWDREPPDEWDFNEYNNENKEPAVLAFLEREGAQAVTIPYRQNRAVIFNSNLFHCTDSFNFRDDYESRRINVTLLYGNRQDAAPRQPGAAVRG